MFVIILSLLFYSRLVNLSWGLPYPMHPDERNMAVALQGLSCKLNDCFNPHFFAYGQLPLYLGYLMILVKKYLFSDTGLISFNEATIALRSISAIASIVNVFVLILILESVLKTGGIMKKLKFSLLQIRIVSLLVFILSPFFIQFSHFGTTESLLMLFYSLIIYFSLQEISGEIHNSKFIILNSLACGLAVATKVSAAIFLIVPLVSIFYSEFRFKAVNSSSNDWIKKSFFLTVRFMIYCFLFSTLFSPYNIISFNEFLSSMRYESAVALGTIDVFYTMQFNSTIPVIFQLLKIFPYALGWPVLILAISGLILLPWKNCSINLLRIAFFVYFIPTAFMYAKWTRFMAPIMPLMLIFSLLSIFYIFKGIRNFVGRNFESAIRRVILCLFVTVCIIPGTAFLSIYQNQDIRFTASEWIYKNIAAGATILSETANVVDMPISKNKEVINLPIYDYISFNFYDLDHSLDLQQSLERYLTVADYVFVPSRRLYKNYTCSEMKEVNIGMTKNPVTASYEKLYPIILNGSSPQKCLILNKKYPVLNGYYQHLFSGALGFERAAEFSQYPKIELFGITLWEFADENAEETWSVFDHPVIRVYRKTGNF